MAARPSGVALDSSAAIALLRNEPGAGTVEQLLRSAPVRMSTVNAAEMIDILVRRHGGEPDEVTATLDQLFSTAVEAAVPSLERALRAGELRARIYDARRRRVSLADCFVLATAEPDDRIVTGDTLLATVARDEGIQVVELHA